MYAIIEVGAKQYSVKKGDIIEVEKQTASEGKEITLDKVLLVSQDKNIEVGAPYLKGAKVTASVLKQDRGVRTIAFKYRRRKASKSQKGHRQYLTTLKIEDIHLG